MFMRNVLFITQNGTNAPLELLAQAFKEKTISSTFVVDGKIDDRVLNEDLVKHLTETNLVIVSIPEPSKVTEVELATLRLVAMMRLPFALYFTSDQSWLNGTPGYALAGLTLQALAVIGTEPSTRLALRFITPVAKILIDYPLNHSQAPVIAWVLIMAVEGK
ncbi:MAG TPA: hypothetical protein VEA59_04895 [Patescibacteria group bacterium]|nr:hypothetical protein [Patescibacteria group bacterium]